MALWKKDPPPPLIDMTPQEYAQLPAVQVQAILTLNRMRVRYAVTGLVCSTLCFLFCVVGFIDLVLQGHNTAAGALLGTTVLGFLGRFIKARY